jgi:hypothetical protein
VLPPHEAAIVNYITVDRQHLKGQAYQTKIHINPFKTADNTEHRKSTLKLQPCKVENKDLSIENVTINQFTES